MLQQTIRKSINFNYLKKELCTKIPNLVSFRDIPHPRSLPVIGTKLNFLMFGSGSKLHEYVDNRHKELGPIFYDRLGGKVELVFISDPMLIKSLFMNLEGKYPAHILPEPWILYEKLYGSKRGLFFMNGEEWLTNRRIMNKHLLNVDTEKWLERPIKTTIENFLSNWKLKAKTEIFMPNLESEFYKLSVDVIVNVLLGSEKSVIEAKHYEELLQIFSESVKRIFQTTTKLYSLPINIIQKLNLKQWREFKESVDFSLFLAQKLVGEIMKEKDKTSGLIKKLSEENLDEEMIIRLIADFVIAAGDTTAYTSQWILYLLSTNTSVTDEELQRDINFTRSIVKEAMRLYPVAPFLTRIILKDCSLGPYSLKAGTPVIASIYTSGRDECNFSQADKFLPHRWERNGAQKLGLTNHVPSATLPFAIGARSCVGKKIAMVQMTEIIKQIIAHFELKCINKTKVRAMTSQVLVPDQQIQILISPRNK